MTIVAIITSFLKKTLRDALLSSPAHLNLLGAFTLHLWVVGEAL